MLEDDFLFNKYEINFSDFKERFTKKSVKIMRKDTLTLADAEYILDGLSRFFSFYSKTEFFYLDRAVANRKKRTSIDENLKKMESIKNQGREYLNALFFTRNNLLEKFLGVLGKQFNIKNSNLFLYTVEELKGLFRYKNISLEEIRRRDRGIYAFDSNGKEVSIKFGLETIGLRDSILRKLEGSDHISDGIIRGIVANRIGRIFSGRVSVVPLDAEKIFNDFNSFLRNMKKGDILVAETTSPEIISACKKAGAIITNQGGMLSHAAIISRELGIPCIVGTRNATDKLKSGNLIKMNMENGAIEIIN